MELNFTVTNQKIKYASNLYIVEKSRNYLTAKFSFSGSEWKNVAKTAIFKKDDTVINVLLDENGRCQVPWEVITKGTLRVSVFGGDLVTVDTADVKILKSGYEEGNAPSEPTPDVYAQILKELQLVREEAITEEVLKQLIEDWLANHEIDVLSKEDVEKIVADYIDKHKDELKGEKGTTFIPKISDEGVLSWTNDGGLPNPEPVELGGGGVPSGDYVPTTRTIAGIDLADDISVEEMQEALDIYDSTIMDGEIKPWLYSEEEIISGTYRGKPLYKKVLEPIIITEDMKKYSIEDIPYEYISIDQSMSFVLRNNASFPITNIGYDANSDTVAGGITQHAYITPDKSITFRKGNGITSYTAYITLQYTKTTDAEGSGSDLNPYGIYNAKLDGVKADIEDVKNSIIETIDTTLENSNAGRLLFTEIKGVMEQGDNPSPTNQQEIKNSVVSGIKTHGKNLVYSDRTSDLVTQGITFHTVRDSLGRILYIEINGTATADAVFNLSKKQLTVGKEYVVSGCPSGGSTETYSLNWAYAGNDVGEGFSHVYNGTEGQLRIRIKNGATVNNLRFYPMLREVGTEATEYEPYTGSSITFSQPIELYGLDDVRDILTSKQIGRKYAYKRILGSNIVKVNANAEYGNSIYTDLFGKPKGKCLCTHFSSVAYEDRTKYLELYRCYIDEVGLDLRLRSSVNDPNTFSDLETTKSFFDANEVYAVYELAEESIEELPIADQIALNSLETFDGITHIEFVSDVQPTFIAKYGTTEMGGMTLESLLTARSNDLRLSAVESAVINNI